RPRQKDHSSSSDSKFRKDRPPVSAEKRKNKGQDSLNEGSLDLENCSVGSVKKRKLKEYQDAQAHSTGNPRLHESRISEQEFSDSRKEKKVRNSRSEGKESSASKGSGRTDKKVSHTKNQKFRQNPGSNHSHRSMDGMDSSKRDLGSVQVSVAATSSSSKVSGSHKTKASFQEVKGSPVESVSSSPLRILSTDKFSNREIMVKDEPHDTAAVDSPRRC
ncbi:CW-type zinc-finger protein, partial [Trifolium medium]|nr:CW-type zinc-finger protein [Trifolium medium]